MSINELARGEYTERSPEEDARTLDGTEASTFFDRFTEMHLAFNSLVEHRRHVSRGPFGDTVFEPVDAGKREVKGKGEPAHVVVEPTAGEHLGAPIALRVVVPKGERLPDGYYPTVELCGQLAVGPVVGYPTEGDLINLSAFDQLLSEVVALAAAKETPATE